MVSPTNHSEGTNHLTVESDPHQLPPELRFKRMSLHLRHGQASRIDRQQVMGQVVLAHLDRTHALPSDNRNCREYARASLLWDAERIDLGFKVGMDADPKQRGVPVHATAAPPQMFREGIGVVVEGVYDGRVFTADRVIVKHSNEYRPPAEGEKPEQVYRTLMNGS